MGGPAPPHLHLTGARLLGTAGRGPHAAWHPRLREVNCVAGKGLEGDRYFGYRENFKGQVTFFEQATVDAVREAFRLPKLPASVFRRNLIVSGVSLREWLPAWLGEQGIGRSLRVHDCLLDGSCIICACTPMLEGGKLCLLRRCDV